MPQVANLHDFRAALVADRWMGNADSRQCIFFRAKVRKWAPSVAAHGSKIDFVAAMIDHGYVFNGPDWSFIDAPSSFYARPSVYDKVTGLDAFQPWLDQVMYFPEQVLEAARREVPPQWLDEGEDDLLDSLLERLLRRRKRVPELLEKCREAHPVRFSNWPK